MKMNDDSSVSSRPSRWKAWLLLLIVFALGSASGVGFGALWLRSKVKSVLTDPYSAESLPLQRMARIESRLARELDLSEEEQAKLRGVFENAAVEYKGLRSGFLDEMQAFSKATYDEIEGALPPEKRADFRKLSAEGVIPWGQKSDGAR